MKTLVTWLLHPIDTAAFAWHLWRGVGYDGTGHRIDFWYAVTWAADRQFWGGGNGS